MPKKIKIELNGEEEAEIQRQAEVRRIEQDLIESSTAILNRAESVKDLGDSQLYCIGGHCVSYESFTKLSPLPSISCLSHSLAVPVWNTIEWPHPRVWFGATVFDRKAFILGGYETLKYKGHNGLGSLDEVPAPLDVMEVFDFQTKTWLPSRKLPDKIAFTAACSLGDFIYFSGGHIGGTKRMTNRFWRYCPRNDRFEEKAPMKRSRAAHKLLALSGYLYAVGGRSTHYLVERYNPVTNQWTEVAPKTPFDSLSTTTVHSGKMYSLCIGRFDVYFPEDDKWIQLNEGPPLPTVGVLASIKKRLVALGSYSIREPSRKVFEFNFETAVWKQLEDMSIDRCSHLVLVDDN